MCVLLQGLNSTAKFSPCHAIMRIASILLLALFHDRTHAGQLGLSRRAHAPTRLEADSWQACSIFHRPQPRPMESLMREDNKYASGMGPSDAVPLNHLDAWLWLHDDVDLILDERAAGWLGVTSCTNCDETRDWFTIASKRFLSILSANPDQSQTATSARALFRDAVSQYVELKIPAHYQVAAQFLLLLYPWTSRLPVTSVHIATVATVPTFTAWLDAIVHRKHIAIQWDAFAEDEQHMIDTVQRAVEILPTAYLQGWRRASLTHAQRDKHWSLELSTPGLGAKRNPDESQLVVTAGDGVLRLFGDYRSSLFQAAVCIQNARMSIPIISEGIEVRGSDLSVTGRGITENTARLLGQLLGTGHQLILANSPVVNDCGALQWSLNPDNAAAAAVFAVLERNHMPIRVLVQNTEVDIQIRAEKATCIRNLASVHDPATVYAILRMVFSDLLVANYHLPDVRAFEMDDAVRVTATSVAISTNQYQPLVHIDAAHDSVLLHRLLRTFILAAPRARFTGYVPFHYFKTSDTISIVKNSDKLIDVLMSHLIISNWKLQFDCVTLSISDDRVLRVDMATTSDLCPFVNRVIVSYIEKELVTNAVVQQVGGPVMATIRRSAEYGIRFLEILSAQFDFAWGLIQALQRSESYSDRPFASRFVAQVRGSYPSLVVRVLNTAAPEETRIVLGHEPDPAIIMQSLSQLPIYGLLSICGVDDNLLCSLVSHAPSNVLAIDIDDDSCMEFGSLALSRAFIVRLNTAKSVLHEVQLRNCPNLDRSRLAQYKDAVYRDLLDDAPTEEKHDLVKRTLLDREETTAHDLVQLLN
jgi:hypothetical protein